MTSLNPTAVFRDVEVVVGAIYQLSFLTLGSTVAPGEDGFLGPRGFPPDRRDDSGLLAGYQSVRSADRVKQLVDTPA